MKIILTSVVLPLFLVLGGLELLSRAAATVRSDLQNPPDEWFEYSSTLGWAPAPGFSGTMECGVGRDFDAHGFRSVDSSQVGDAGGQQVVFLGDSTTMGFCVETESTFVELIDAELPAASAINLGVNGYTSYQGYTVLRQTSALLDPDVIVVSFNFNDRRYVLDPSQADSPRSFTSTARLAQLQGLIRKSYLLRSLQFGLRSVGLVEEVNIPSTVDLQSLRPRVTLQEYRENLASIARWARDNGSEVLFVLLGDNPVRTAHLSSGIQHLRAAEFEEALEDLWIARRDRWFADLARLQQRELYQRMSRHDDAAAVTIAPTYWSLHGGWPIVLDTDYNDAMRDVANEFGIEVVDARVVLEEYPGIFLDNAHFDARGHRIAADVLVEPIRKLLANSGRR